MFDFVRKHTKLLQLILFLLIFPSFVLFGIQGYDRFSGSGNVAAKVDGIPISMQELDAAQRSEVARMQQALGASADIKSLDTPEAKMRTLDGMIRQLVLQVAVRKQHLAVSDSDVQQAILQIPQIAALRKRDGSFDLDAYRKLIEAQGMSTGQFEAQVREQLLLQQALGGIGESVIESKAIAGQLYAWQNQRRQVRVALYQASDYASQVQPTAAEVEAFYKAHLQSFQVPQQATVQYVVLDPTAVRKSVTVTPEEVKAYYEKHIGQFNSPEQRKASHILIALPPNPTPAQEQAAKAQADKILAQLHSDPAQFAAIAKRDSQDPGSAPDGGNLGYFTRDGMVKPFADAVFAMHKVGEIVGPVKSQYGYHIIELTGIKPAEQKTLAQVQGEIKSQLEDQAAQARFADVADQFKNMVYEDSRSFADVADKLHLEVRTAQGVTPTPNPGDAKTDPLANAKFLQALFSENSVRDKRNIPAVDIGSNTLVSGRIVSYQPATTLGFSQAQSKARDLLVRVQSANLATKAGEEALIAAKQGKAQPPWGAPLEISQDRPSKDAAVPPPVVAAAFQLSPATLPALTGVVLPGQGYAIVSIDSVSNSTPDAEQLRAQQGTMSQILSRAVTEAYIDSLKKRYGVEVLYKIPARATG
ncbi:SurA N-terminal domain-containing protein [Thiomonas sp. FB-Cd]|uniref:SurA N-terminal domain-containing protein n=1 Tax=Thiomonas sp. FB-Cd TaxID=1158292 RepID=UPI0004DF02B0|nr:SurA N-terminal domain-containing protein [Thiomonas sp. FB-Cd]